jgi:hypothetical protein
MDRRGDTWLGFFHVAIMAVCICASVAIGHVLALVDVAIVPIATLAYSLGGIAAGPKRDHVDD